MSRPKLSTREVPITRTRTPINAVTVTAIHYCNTQFKNQLECGPMPNVMAALPNIGGALCSTPQFD